MTNLENGAILNTDSYLYANLDWEDQLTSFNGKEITYDAIGNPLTIGSDVELTWVNGRSLKSYSDTSKSLNVSYKYNSDGIREEKTVNGSTTKYYLEGTSIVYEEKGTRTIYYLYDATGVIGLKYNNSTYLFEKNQQGDITGIMEVIRMKNGINIFVLTNCIPASIEDFYLNLKNGNIVDDYCYINLSETEKKEYEIIPRVNLRDRLKIAEKYFNEERNAKYKKILFEEYTTEFIDEINDVNEIHWMLENYKIRDDFLDYEDEEYKKIAIEWCKEHNLKYYYEVIYVDDINQSMYDLVDKLNSNKERLNYYAEKSKNRL